MGNQLTGIAPSQILPVDHYLTGVREYEFDISLGSTRFFKVARAKSKDGLFVVKVFVIQDPSLPLKTYKDQLEDFQRRLRGASNCLPFQRALVLDKAALLLRQYIQHSLYDRISTRPFLITIEKKWLSFQLLCAVNQAHKLQVCHGDIKSQNVMITSWNWLLLTDFASYKPTYLPQDDPADFSYFFDTSRRRTCYLAPERFVESSGRHGDPAGPVPNLDLAIDEVLLGGLTPAMDIFSVGCVIGELFTDGTAPFDLSELLAYRSGEFTPKKLLQKIPDSSIRSLIEHMLQHDSTKRLSAEEYLLREKGGCFPSYFYTFLKLYIQQFVTGKVVTPDDRVTKIHKDVETILENLEVSESDAPKNSSLVLLISVITSNLRSLKFCKSKLLALELLLRFGKLVESSIVLDRLIPYMLYFVDDPFPRVRAEAIRAITQCLSVVNTVPLRDANIFPEYILPHMNNLAQDPVVMVRVVYAENIALLAETAHGFLEMVQLDLVVRSASEKSQETSQYQTIYDEELNSLHEMIQQKVVTLLSDPDNIVKRALLENGITRLCVFFGRQKANDVLLSHMITFLNDKQDWELRSDFFKSLVGLATYVGWQSSSILKPLLQQGLTDTEEFVIYTTLGSLTSLMELSLLQKQFFHELLVDVVPFLCHPNLWIRQGAVGFVAAVARRLNIADVHCYVLPLLQAFLQNSVTQVDRESVLLNALRPPITRVVYDYVLRAAAPLERFFECLQDRRLIRKNCRPRFEPTYAEVDPALTQLFRKLTSQGMMSHDEDKMLLMKDFMLKLHRARGISVDSSSSSLEIAINNSGGGNVDLSSLVQRATCRHADLVKWGDPRLAGPPTPVRRLQKRLPGRPDSPTQIMNDDWKLMFGSTAASSRSDGLERVAQPPTTSASTSASTSTSTAATTAAATAATTAVTAAATASTTDVSAATTAAMTAAVPLATTPAVTAASTTAVTQGRDSVTAEPGPTLVATRDDLERSNEDGLTNLTLLEKPTLQVHYPQCRLDLHELVQNQRRRYANDRLTSDLLASAAGDAKAPPSGWRPRGILVAHLHEHRGAVNRMQVSADRHYFLTCSNDGSVKLWDCGRMEGKSVMCRSRLTYTKQGGQVKTAVFCEAAASFASASDNGTIHVIKTDTGACHAVQTVNLDVDGHIVDMAYFDTGTQNVIVYATVSGVLTGWDIRAPTIAWQLHNQSKYGLITSFAVHPLLHWLVIASSSGNFVCWDMRFQLPVTTVTHPNGSRIKRVITHPTEQSWIVASIQGNNEVSMWDLETGARERSLWASPAPPLSLTQASGHCVSGMHYGVTDGQAYLLTAGTDMRIRYWDLNYPAQSYLVASAASDPLHQTAVSYRSQIIEGTEVVQEMYGKPRAAVSDDSPRRGPDDPPIGHHDVITDIVVCQKVQTFVVTASRDGVIKVWK